jgi:hypothetical protein
MIDSSGKVRLDHAQDSRTATATNSRRDTKHRV